MSLAKIDSLTRQLYPNGRAFKIPFGGFFEKMINGLNQSEARVYSDLIGVTDQLFTDSPTFSDIDAARWFDLLGINENDSLTLEQKKQIIFRKVSFTNDIRARQSYLYLERELQLAGFDVYVFENRFDDGMGGLETRTPLEVSGISGDVFQLGDEQLGDFQLGGASSDLVANHVRASEDSNFDVGSNLRSTFFIGGTPVGQFADVEASRELEFRELILKIKPLQTIAYLFCRFV